MDSKFLYILKRLKQSRLTVTDTSLVLPAQIYAFFGAFLDVVGTSCFQNSDLTKLKNWSQASSHAISKILRNWQPLRLSKVSILKRYIISRDTGRKLKVHKTFRRFPGCLLNVLCTFNLRPVSTGMRQQAWNQRINKYEGK